jgi:triacylglycerol lipase
MRSSFPIIACIALALPSASGCTTQRIDDPQVEQRQAADWMLLVADVGDAYLTAPNDLRPAFPHWKSLPPQWQVDGYVIGDDHVPLHANVGAPRPSMHGVVASTRDAHGSPEYVVLLRGTVGAREWEIDAFAPHRAAPWPDSGHVPAGFLDLYESLTFLPVVGDAMPGRAAQALHDRIGTAPVTVIGHSAGAVLGTYLSMDLALDDTTNRIAGRFFASARPGDAAYADAYLRVVPDHRVFNNVRDLVPDLPPGFGRDGYKPLRQVTPLDPSQRRVPLRDSAGCNHHAVSYAALLDFDRMPVAAWQARLAASQQPRNCIGQVPALRTLLP